MNRGGLHSPPPVSTGGRFPYLPDILATYSPKLSKPSNNIFECGLTRSDYLAQDKNKMTLKLFKKRQSKDISYFYETLRSSPLITSPRDFAACPLPTNIQDLKSLLESDAYSEKLLTGISPSSRTDAENLSDWLGEMQNSYLVRLEKIIESKQMVDQGLAETAETIFTAVIKEGLKQGAASCLTRTNVMLRAFERLIYVLKKSVQGNEKALEDLNNRKNTELEKLKISHQQVVQSLNVKIEDLALQTQYISKENELLQNEINMLKKTLSKPPITEEPKPVKKQAPVKARLQSKHKYVQTEQIREESSEDSSSCDEEDFDKVEEEKEVMQVMNIEKKLSRQSTKMLEKKKAEQVMYLHSKIQQIGCEEGFNIEELYLYISKEFLDFYAWVDGFRTSAEYFKKKIEDFKEKPAQNTVSIPVPTRVEDKRKSFKESKFLTLKARNTQTMAQQITEVNPVEKIINRLSNQTRKRIEQYSKMPYKKISAQITNYLNLCRTKGLENFDNLGILVYSELFQTYCIKHFARRKFKEFVSSCIKFSSDPKAQIFLRMLGGGKCIGLSSFSATECKLVVRCYEFMVLDKTGIIRETGISEPVFFPTSRAIECVKQVFDGYFHKSQIFKLIKTIEEMSKSDPDLINPKGLIDIHAFILTAVQQYKDYFTEYFNAVQFAVKALNETETVSVSEIHLLVRNISPKKKLKNFQVELKENKIMDLNEFYSFCLGRAILRPDDVRAFFDVKTLFTVEQVQDLKEKVIEILSKLDGVVTINEGEWESKLDDILIWSKMKKGDEALKLWRLLSSEFEYLLSTFDLPL